MVIIRNGFDNIGFVTSIDLRLFDVNFIFFLKIKY